MLTDNRSDIVALQEIKVGEDGEPSVQYQGFNTFVCCPSRERGGIALIVTRQLSPRVVDQSLKGYYITAKIKRDSSTVIYVFGICS